MERLKDMMVGLGKGSVHKAMKGKRKNGLEDPVVKECWSQSTGSSDWRVGHLKLGLCSYW